MRPTAQERNKARRERRLNQRDQSPQAAHEDPYLSSAGGYGYDDDDYYGDEHR